MSLIGKTLQILWYDAEMKYEVDKEEDIFLRLPIVKTIGMCINDNNELIALAAEELPNTYRSVTLIPKCLIIKQKKLIVEDIKDAV